MKKTILFFISSVALVSCNLNNAPENKIPAKLDSIKISRDEKPVATTFMGLYHPHSSELIISCEKGKTYKLKSNPLLDSLYKKILPNAYTDEAVYLEVIAAFDPNDPGVINFETGSLVKMEQKNFKNTCVVSDYWCSGTEPFWQIQISEKENLIDFYNPMEQKTTHFIYSKPEIKNGMTYYISSDKGNKISIIIKKEKCNGAIDTQYDYSVQVQLNDRNYSGCAIKP